MKTFGCGNKERTKCHVRKSPKLSSPMLELHKSLLLHYKMPTAPHIINMLGDTIYLEVDGIHQDWNTYRFDLNIGTPGKKVGWLYLIN